MSLFAGQDRESLREAWRVAWRRQLERLPLTPLQAQMVEVISLHPEHHAQLARDVPAADPDNDEASRRAFLQLALHLALREQISTNRPRGIVQIHRELAARRGVRDAELRMMAVLEHSLWEAQRAGHPPDEAVYLESLQRL
jgi:hypothetical protein